MDMRLGRGMENLQWMVSFPNAFIDILPRCNSNHNLILVRCGGLPQSRGRCFYRFEETWIDHIDYPIVEDGQATSLTCPITLEEIKVALFSM